MQTPSRPPSSNQRHLHRRLARTVHRHLGTPSLKPVAAHNLAAFNTLLDELAARPRPLILDSFCGTGHSTAAIARSHPRHLVVGIDKSGHRLARHPPGETGNYLLLQAECGDIWRLLAEARIGIDQHFLLYPNPWPKEKHLQRRIHGDASFSWLLQLAAGRTELRSNWQTYVEEFGVAMQLAGYPGIVSRIVPESPISLFERKYRDSGHSLWVFRAATGGRCSPHGRDLTSPESVHLVAPAPGRDE